MNVKHLKTGFASGFIIFCLAVGIIAVRAQEGQPTAGYTVFIPGVFKDDPQGHIISGRVLSPGNVPIAGVTIRTDQGQAVITDLNGDYSLSGLGEGVYTLTPSQGGTTFSPASSAVVVPPDVNKLNFTAQVECAEVIANGGFEGDTGWELPVTPYRAGYSTAQVHTGTRSMRTGIYDPGDNIYSYSSARQQVIIPAGTTNAYLNFWIKPYSGEVKGNSLPVRPKLGLPLDEIQMSGDVQYVLILDNSYNTIKTLIWQLSDSQTWTEYEVSLTSYAGQTIWLQFGTYNDGLYGASSMFVDDVSLEICPAGGTPAPTPTPGPCTNLLDNPGFETVGDWEIPITEFTAGYSNAQKHSGSWSMRTGILNAADNTYSYSDFRQAVTLPSGGSSSTARFWLYTLSGESKEMSQPEVIKPTGRPFNETVLSGDLQYVLILDRYQNWIDTLVWQRTDEGYWHSYEFDLRRYAGQTIYLQFGTYNDGWNGITSMFVDDTSMGDCVTTPTPGPSPTPTRTPTASPTPTRTPTPGPCSEYIVNGDFSGSDGWEIPFTNYPAGYSNTEYHSAFQSMRTGIVNPAYNTYSYSDFRQKVSIPSNSNHVTLGMWLYPISGEIKESLPPKPALGSPFSETQMSGDVQYLLVMDTNYNILDVLIWQLSDSQTWTYEQFDLHNYGGWTILLQWGTYNDGGGGITAMYVDDVSLQVCH
jgi:hypothetical protein